ncbi:MAG: ComEC/Rec2 family competence protein [Eubacteriales bacterium]
MNRKFLVLFACILIANTALSIASCGDKTKRDDTVFDEETETDHIEEAFELLIAEKGKALYTIIRDEDANDLIVDTVIYFRRTLEEKTGISFKLETDWTKYGAELDMESTEITVGITNRNSDRGLESIGNLEYRLEINGNNIEIIARGDKALKAAIDKFLSDDIIRITENGSVFVSGIPVNGKVELSEGEIPYYEFGEIENIYSSSENTVIVKANGTTAEDYGAYLDLLHEAGFEDYASNKIGDNLFTTLTNNTTTISYYYIANTGVTRVVCEPKRDLFAREQDNVYEERGYDSLLTGMEGETSVAAEGMGFIIRLCDGSFVIIDGGMGDPDHIDSNKLFNILKSQSPEGTEKPVIAAWLFTHLHGDHVGVFNCFSIDFHDKVVIESFYYNFPKEEEVAASDSPYMLDNSIYRFNQFKKCMSEYYSEVSNIKVHTGDKFYVRNAVFEVLSTLEDLYPKSILDGGMNESTVMYKMTLGEQTTLWTGDIASIATDFAVRHFGDYLRSDMLQMAHHGMNGSVEFYSIANPNYSFLPTWDGGYESFKNYPQNQWLINSEKMKHMIVTSCGTWTIKLPYKPADGTYDRIPARTTVNPVYPHLLGE